MVAGAYAGEKMVARRRVRQVEAKAEATPTPISTVAPPPQVTTPAPTEIKRCPHCGASLAGQKGEFCHNCWKKIK